MKPIDEHAQGLAGGAARAARPKEHGPEAPPAPEQALLVLGRVERGHLFIFELPKLLRKIAAPAGGSDKVEERLHGDSDCKWALSGLPGKLLAFALEVGGETEGLCRVVFSSVRVV
jgi:hypothetical protein